MSIILVLGPINGSARLRMNQKPESDNPPFSIPKIQMNLEMGKLFVGISKSQYRDIIALADTLGRMSKGVPYRKYRPHLNEYKGHYKEWWHFAYQCILENVVKRRRRNWNWEHIRLYRNKCRQYSGLYKKQLSNKVGNNSDSSSYKIYGVFYVNFFFFRLKETTRRNWRSARNFWI